MLLAQKPQSLNFRHRRHPASMSGITVVPHPTSTPGMFALAKPIRQQPRGQRSQSPRLQPRGRFHRPGQDLTSVEVPTYLQLQQQQQASPKHLSSHAAHAPPAIPVAAVNVATQESSVVILAQQAPTAPLAIAAHPTGRIARTRRSRHKSTPTAIIQDRGADNAVTDAVQRDPSPVPVKPLMASAPIAVPERRRAQTPPHRQHMSRSDPAVSKLTIQTSLPLPKATRKEKRRKNKVKRVAPDGAALPLAEWDFPAPGESDEEEDDDPVTPIKQTGSNDRAWVNAFNDGPKTAPLQSSGTQGQFPFFTFPQRPVAPRAKTPLPASTYVPVTPPRLARPDHRRVPSQPASLSRATGAEGMFHFSEDETDPPPNGQLQKKMAMLFGDVGPPSAPATLGTGSPSPSSRKKGSRDRESVDLSRQLFASSSFQIAPEPVDLPTPSFFLRFKQ